MVQCALDKGGEDKRHGLQLVRLDAQTFLLGPGLLAHPAVLIPACMALSAGVAVAREPAGDGNAEQLARLKEQVGRVGPADRDLEPGASRNSAARRRRASPT
jgi:hypothetical protein